MLRSPGQPHWWNPSSSLLPMPGFVSHIPHLICLCVPPSSLHVLCGDRELWALLSPSAHPAAGAGGLVRSSPCQHGLTRQAHGGVSWIHPAPKHLFLLLLLFTNSFWAVGSKVRQTDLALGRIPAQRWDVAFLQLVCLRYRSQFHSGTGPS